MQRSEEDPTLPEGGEVALTMSGTRLQSFQQGTQFAGNPRSPKRGHSESSARPRSPATDRSTLPGPSCKLFGLNFLDRATHNAPRSDRAPPRGVGPRGGADNLRPDGPRGARPVRRGPGNMASERFGGRLLADTRGVELRSRDSHASHGPWGPAAIPVTGTRLGDFDIRVSRARSLVRASTRGPRTPPPSAPIGNKQRTCHEARKRSEHPDPGCLAGRHEPGWPVGAGGILGQQVPGKCVGAGP